jgi:ribosomal protein L37E
MQGNKILCRKCGKLKSKYNGAKEYCQSCYRELLEEYSYYDYAVDKNRIHGTALRVCEMLIEEGIDRLEIHEILGLHKCYVRQIINKYTVRVNREGERRPF